MELVTMKLANKVVVITGSGGGIGAACARRFAAEGAKVLVTDINTDSVSAVASEIGSEGLAGDISQEETVRAVAELARRAYGEIDIWFSNAGVAGPRGARGDISDNARWESMWALHVMSHVYAVREVVPSMLERGDGYLLQTSSLVALLTQPEKAAYSVTKHAGLALAEWLAVNYRPRGIKVSCFCAPAMRTAILEDQGFPADHPVFKAAMTPEAVASLLVDGIDAERFLIVESSTATDPLAERAEDYERWLTKMESPQF